MFRSMDLRYLVPSRSIPLDYDFAWAADQRRHIIDVPNLRIRSGEHDLANDFAESLTKTYVLRGITDYQVRTCLEHAEGWIRDGI